ncbi:unnamed protein product [Caenorhabditis nigoni]
MSSFFEMPELVVENIIGFLDFRSVLALRQVCRDFLNFIDDLNDSKLPDSKFTNIDIIVETDIRLVYKRQRRLFDPILHTRLARSYYEYIYSGSENSRSFNGKITSFENSNIADVAIRDLQQVLKFQKSTLKCSSFDFVDCQILNNSQFPNFMVKLSSMFEKLNRKFRWKGLSITAESQSKYMSILPFSDPETLESLALCFRNVNIGIGMDEIVKTEQWKNAKTISCNFYALNMKVEDMSDFSRVYMKLHSISARDLDFLRKTFITSTKFEMFELQLRNFNENEGIPDVWGPAFHFLFTRFFSRTWSYWYFRIKGSEKKILRIWIRQQDRHICFDIIEMRDVPNGAIVHDYNKN